MQSGHCTDVRLRQSWGLENGCKSVKRKEKLDQMYERLLFWNRSSISGSERSVTKQWKMFNRSTRTQSVVPLFSRGMGPTRRENGGECAWCRRVCMQALVRKNPFVLSAILISPLSSTTTSRELLVSSVRGLKNHESTKTKYLKMQRKKLFRIRRKCETFPYSSSNSIHLSCC